ncbi:MAG: hypothetical protein KY475_19900 [Planctomycetes bacterium]|nr:hypothetical protein [Planctomycetota bacterium]
MKDPVHRRSFLAVCAAPGAAGLLGASPQIMGSVHLATLPEWGLQPGSREDQSTAFQSLIDAVAERGGGTILLPPEHGATRGSYLVQGLRPRSNVLIAGLHGAALQLPKNAVAHLIDNHAEVNVSRFALCGLILDGGGQDRTLVRIKRSGSSGYAWDRGGMYDIELRNAAIGAEVDWAGQVYYHGGRVQNCREGLRLTREHLYLRDITIWGCKTGVFAQQLLHTHWDHVVFAHGGPGSTAVQTPDSGGPHLQESRLVNCEIIDYRRGLDLRYVLDTEISGWRFKSIDYEGIRAAYSGMVELGSCRFLNCGADPSGEFSAVRIVESASHEGWRIHDNLARDAKQEQTMKHGFDLSGLSNTANAVVGHGNHVRGAVKAGYFKRRNHTKFTPDQNIGDFATV